MAKKIRSAAELQEKFDEINAQADAALDAQLPRVPAIERKVALLMGRTPAFFSGARVSGSWILSLHRKIALLKDLERHGSAIADLRRGMNA